MNQSEPPTSEDTCVDQSSAIPKQGILGSALSTLAFKHHGARVGMELSFCVLSFSSLKHLAPWSELGVTQQWAPLYSWFAACLLTVALDNFLFGRAHLLYRGVMKLSAAGCYNEALSTLNRLAAIPGNSLLRLPEDMYRIKRSELLSLLGEHEAARRELWMARGCGMSSLEYHLAVSCSYLHEQRLEDARAELGYAEDQLGALPEIELARGRLMLENRASLSEAKAAFRNALAKSALSGNTAATTDAATKGFFAVTQLWTGEAEQGIDGLNDAIAELKAATVFVDSIRPLVAALAMERAYYLATHQQPDAAIQDMNSALTLCSYPAIRKLAERVRDELQWRYSGERKNTKSES